jgi:hypothetical protein
MTRRLGAKLRRTAYHEAGHAIIGMTFGRGVAFIRLVPPSDRRDGLHGQTGWEAEDVVMPARIADLCSIAGDIVELSHGARSVGHLSEIAEEICAKHSYDPEHASSCEALSLVREAQELVVEHGADIERLAFATLADYRAGGNGLVNLRPLDWISGWSANDDAKTERQRRAVNVLLGTRS